jgi:hypothetical protein
MLYEPFSVQMRVYLKQWVAEFCEETGNKKQDVIEMALLLFMQAGE